MRKRVVAGEYTRRMEELDLFKNPNEFPPRRGGYGLTHVDCVGRRAYTNDALVKLYAKLGLHRYNWLEGTNFELDSLMNFNMRGAASPYYMTLVVRLPSSGLQQIFQVLVAERRIGILDLTCLISRPQSKETETSKKESTPFLRPHSEPESTNYQDRLLGWTRIKSAIPWPSAFSDTKQRFYMLNESELQCDWISLYVELQSVLPIGKSQLRNSTSLSWRLSKWL
ncbi:hypothetical protein Bca52824_000488 [Brassica carinata]|uniref:Uncharacterized protein n=2 Tax=Brassica TaxID=3705 RepID=A0A8X7WJD2_BRACI|nr:hypothetical protein Bca52824_000488 [Brassica carinata]